MTAANPKNATTLALNTVLVCAWKKTPSPSTLKQKNQSFLRNSVQGAVYALIVAHLRL